jgi:hypothetical protein
MDGDPRDRDPDPEFAVDPVKSTGLPVQAKATDCRIGPSAASFVRRRGFLIGGLHIGDDRRRPVGALAAVPGPPQDPRAHGRSGGGSIRLGQKRGEKK